MFSEIAGVAVVLGVMAIGAWQFRAIIIEDDLKRLQSRAHAILAIGAAGWVLWLLDWGF